MRPFGIILTIVNLLAAGAFVYFATQDWQGRQRINAAGLRHLLLIQGLPLDPPPKGEEFDSQDETPFHIEMGGGVRTKTISKKLLEKHFADNIAAAPGSEKISFASNAPVTNQIAEVKRVYGIIKTELSKPELTTDAKITLLAGWLLLQAQTLDERIEYQTLISPKDADDKDKTPQKRDEDAKKLEEKLFAKFDGILTPKPFDASAGEPLPDLNKILNELKQLQDELDKMIADKETAEAIQAKRAEILAKQKERDAAADKHKERADAQKVLREAAAPDEMDRRLRLAHLLVHLDPDAAWQKRVVVIVGLRRYVKTLATQAEMFLKMVARLEKHFPIDQATYVNTENGYRERAIQYSQRSKDVAEQRATLSDQKTTADDLVARRQTQIDDLTTQLNRIKAEVDTMLLRQSGIEKQLFEIQREVALTLDEVYRLEALLTTIERQRYSPVPKQ